jgi:opacity protein-like surface antigen
MRASAALAVLSLSAALPMGPAMAADMLPPVPTLEDATHSDFSWEGLYGGIHAGAGTADFTNQDDLGGLVNQTWNPVGLTGLASVASVDNSSSDNQALIGAFVGYNRTFDDAVVGVELGYNHWFSKMQGDSTNAGVATNSAGGVVSRLNWSAEQTSRLGDYLDLRVRGGWAWDRVLFYGTLGVVVANQKVATSYQGDATITTAGVLTASYSPSPAYISNSGWNYGFSAGLGVDVAFLDNVFARAEYEYIGMADFKGTSVSAHIGRVGIGIKY